MILMKIIFTTTFLVAVLAIGLLGISNSGSNSNNIDKAFAQGDDEMMGNDTGGMMNATLAYAAQDNSERGEKYRDMGENIGREFEKIEEGNEEEYRETGESIGREFENIEKGTIRLNENSTTTMMNATLPISLIGNDTAKPMNAILPISLIGNDTSKKQP